VLAASIIGAMMALIMEAASTSETSVNFYQTTWLNNPEDSHFHTHCHENLNVHYHIFDQNQSHSFFIHVPLFYYFLDSQSKSFLPFQSLFHTWISSLNMLVGQIV
jgi:hypothetical protein